MEEEKEKNYGVMELAKLLKVSSSTICRRAASGKINAFKKDGNWIIPKFDVVTKKFWGDGKGLTRTKKIKGHFSDLTGQRFSRLSVIGEYPQRGSRGQVLWICKCDCGEETATRGESLRSGKAKSCGCLQKEKASLNGKLKAKPSNEVAGNTCFCSYKNRARLKGVGFDLSKKEFVGFMMQPCFYCGEKAGNKFKHSKGDYKDYFYNGIDRLDSSLGYAKGNVVPCCKNCNYAKGVRGFTEFVDWVKKIYSNLGRRGYV